MPFTAVVDLGYNSVRLSLYQRFSPNTFRLLGSIKRFVRLGEGVDEGKPIRDEKVKLAVSVMGEFREVLRRRGVDEVIPVGTSAFRYASNGEEVAQELSRALGREVKIISGEDEGRLAALSAVNSLPISEALVFELGGGSLEVVYVSNRELEKVFHFPLGGLRLSKAFRDQGEIRREIRNYLYSLPSRFPPVLVGSGGNVRSMGRYAMKMRGLSFNHVHGFKLAVGEVNKMVKRFWSLSPEELAKLPGMGKERAVTIPAASLVVEELVNMTNPQYIFISELGMREGKLMSKEMNSTEEMRDSWVDAFTRGFNVEPPWDVKLEGEKRTGSTWAGYASLLSQVIMWTGRRNPFRECFDILQEVLFPGFTQVEIGLVAGICRAASGKVKGEELRRLGVDMDKGRLRETGEVVRKLIQENPLGGH
jgi:Exopolyphosphatase